MTISKTVFALSLINLLVANPGHALLSQTPSSFGIQSSLSQSCLSRSFLSYSPGSEQNEPTEDQENQPLQEDISDLDARVLRSMLTDGSLDLLTEDDMLKLLERASGPKDASLPPFPPTESDTSDYESKTLQALMDTKLWKALSAKKDDLLESAKIYIENRIERDSRLLATLGVFVWDRVVRDVARALPAAGSSTSIRTATRQLKGAPTTTTTASVNSNDSDNDRSNQSSDGTRMLENLNLFEELNTPLDEIKSVTQAIQDILKGEASSSTSQRGIRTAAPAGQKTRTERQQRAYQKRKQTVLKREKEGVDVLRVAGTVVDVAYEVRRDLQVEVNKPGYKTERVRTAIAAGAETTSRVIAAARDGPPGAWRNILFGNKEMEQVMELSSAESTLPIMLELPELPDIPIEPTLIVPDVPLPVELVDERASVVSRLRLCIEKPEDTWLTQEVLARSSEELNPDSLRDVVTAMIIARDDLDITVAEPTSVKDLIGRLRKVKSTIDTVLSMAETCGGMEVADNLRNILFGYEPGDDIQPTLLSLNDIQTIYESEIRDAETAAQVAFAEAVAERDRAITEWEQIFEERERLIQESKERAAQILVEEEKALWNKQLDTSGAVSNISNAVVEADPSAIDAFFVKSIATSDFISSSKAEAAVVDDYFQSAVAEVISDDLGFDYDIGSYRTVSTDSEEDMEESESNLFVDASLRSLDIVLAVTEKTVLLLPGVFKVASIASIRLDDASRGGLGRIGWNRLAHTETGSKRY